MNTSPPDFLLIERYIAGTALPAERQEVETLIASDPGYHTLVTSLRHAWDTELDVSQRWNAQAAYTRGVQRRVRIIARERDGVAAYKSESITPPGQIARQFAKPPVFRSLAFGLAAAVVLVSAVLLGRNDRSRSTTGTPTSVLVYSTGNGQRATVSLPDGSQVLLNVGSRLEVPANYTSGHPVFRLRGEAIFNVAHRAAIPFTVLAGPSVTRVLGTSFLVRHYPADTTALVAVREGKVTVGSMVLTAAQQVEVHAHGMSPVRAVRAGHFSFETGVLTLPGLSLPAAIPELNRWYDADIRLGDLQLSEQYIKGSFAAGSLGDLAEFLEGALNVRVVRDGRILTLYPR